MASHTSIGRLRLAWLQLVAGVLFLAVGSASQQLLARKDAVCAAGSVERCDLLENNKNFAQVKCQRCQTSIADLMNTVSRTTGYNAQQDECYDMIFKFDTHYANYFSNAEFLSRCSQPRNLLYDGAVGCNCNARVISQCAGKKDFYRCLCGLRFGYGQISCMDECFGDRGQLNLDVSCPEMQKAAPLQYPDGRQSPRPAKLSNNKTPIIPKTKNKGNAASVKAQKAIDGGNESASDETYEGNGVDKRPWPPLLDEQFSELLEASDRDVSFYIDINERYVFVDTDTSEVIHYEPYFRYPAPSYDKILDSTIKNRKWLERCYYYPQSNRVWCFSWLVKPEVYEQYAAAPSIEIPPPAASTGYSMPVTSKTASSFSSSSSSSSNPSKSTSSTSGSTPTGSSSAAVSVLAPFCWSLAIQFLAIMYYGY